MADGSAFLTIGTFFSAFIGAALSVAGDRLLRRLESRPLFRIQVGGYEDLKGEGTTLTITNVGLNPVPEYRIWLFHPDRGSTAVFHPDPSQLVFPQYPEQENEFRCQTRGRAGNDDSSSSYLKGWFLRMREKEVAAPSFVGFELRLEMRNSKVVLFRHEALGNYIAKEMYEAVIGMRVEQQVKSVFYCSKAPFWVEMIRKRRIRRMIRDLKRQASAKRTTVG